MPKISIISAYFNRKTALLRTLKTIEKSSVKDFEYIIIDDGSDQGIEDLSQRFSFIRLKRIKNKTHINPCIPLNMAIAMVKSDLVLMQSPECMHIGDVLKYSLENSKNNYYHVFSCYSLSDYNSNALNDLNFNSSTFELSLTNMIGGFTKNNCEVNGRDNSWFIHPDYRHAHLNFLSVMTKKDLYDLGGFDERFANGYAFEDSEFVSRVKKKGMKIQIVKKPFCIHQYHTQYKYNKELRNKKLYKECNKSPEYQVKNSFIKQ